MRLNRKQQVIIQNTVRKEKRTVESQVAFLADLKKQMGDQRIDIVFKSWSAPKSVFQKTIDKTKVPF